MKPCNGLRQLLSRKKIYRCEGDGCQLPNIFFVFKGLCSTHFVQWNAEIDKNVNFPMMLKTLYYTRIQ
jgi:hypothetical protein